jgi:OPA family glycerol-3-phosphate transporter-like MFS transporter
MGLILVALCLVAVIWLYFTHNPLHHSKAFMMRRFINWFPLGMSYAFLYMARYNLNVSKNALGAAMSKESFGLIFGIGTTVYGLSFLINGPLIDKIGGKKGIVMATLGSSIANIAMGIVTFLFLKKRLNTNLTVVFAILYSINMFFQSYGAVSIIKVKAYWFHVRERGIFGGIFGTLISFGVYFAFDWGQALADAAKLHLAGPPTVLQSVFRAVFAVDTGTSDAIWMVFFIPAFILIVWALIDTWLIKDTPGEADFEDFDTLDASSGEMDKEFSTKDLLVRVFTNPILIMIALVEFTTGVIRNGVMQWYFVFANEVKQPGAEFFHEHWGLLLCITGIFAGFLGGIVSDKYFQSRRGPPCAMFFMVMVVLTAVMAMTLRTSPIIVGFCAVGICLFSIGVHALMSGTAASDFGGRKATATASGITDGFVYLGSGVQSFALGFLTTKNWILWPIFLMPFTVLGVYFTLRLWKALPPATRKYVTEVEKISVGSA